MQGRAGTILICLTALLWVLAFTPDPYVWAAIPGVVGMLTAIERLRSTKHVVWLTVLFGGLAIGCGYHWLAQTVQDFGDVPVVPSWLLTALFGVVGTVHVLVFALIFRAMCRGARRPHPLTVVALWVVCEALPIRLFPWMLGHGAVNCPPLLQQAEWGGVSGVSFVMLCFLVPLYEWIRWALRLDGSRHRARAAAAVFVLGLLLFGWGQWRYRQVLDEDKQAEKHWRVAIVQPNVGARDKRMAERERSAQMLLSIDRLRTLSEKAAAEKAELVVWPETAVTYPIRYMLPKFDPANTSNSLARAQYRFLETLGRDRAFLIGSYEYIPPPEGHRMERRKVDWRHNVAALRHPGGRLAMWDVYRKVYLIPFGETMPLGLPQDRLPQSFVMKPGSTDQKALAYEGRRIVPFLCYEGILPDHVRAVAGKERTDILVSLTNDSWFGDTWEPHQHLNFTRFRAVEHRAPLVRATNTGISAFVDAAGQIVKGLGLYNHDALVHDVPLVERPRTVYVSLGYLFPWLMAFVALFGFAFGRRATTSKP